MSVLRQVIAYCELARVVQHLSACILLANLHLSLQRSLTEMENELKALGVPLPPKPYGKREIIELLARTHWEKQHPGQPMPHFISPMLIKNIKDVPEERQKEIWESPDWFAEQKRNGLRITSYFTDQPHFRTRGVSVETYLPGDVTPGLWWLAQSATELTDTVVDGEIVSTKKQIDTSPYVAGGKGTKTNNVLQAAVALLSIENSKAAQAGNGMPLRYVLYDIMRFKGEDVTKQPYTKRRELLTMFYVHMKPKIGEALLLNDTTNINKRKYYQDLIDRGEEGVVLKYGPGLYKEGPTRTDEQYKAKRQLELDAAITGFTRPKKDSTYEKEGLIGGVVFSVKDITDGQWYEVGSVSNITMEQRRAWSVKNPDGTLKGLNQDVLWTVYEVQAQEWNPNLKMQHLRIVRPRTGVDAKNLDEVTYDRQALLKEFGREEEGT